jgi:4-amino-4-deoxy-L-arabinose transferase-like glycosyltransferase
VRGNEILKARFPSDPRAPTEVADTSEATVVDQSRIPRPAVWAILLFIGSVAGLLYAWGIANDPLEPYYEAAVRSMSLNWHNFFYGAFDPAGTMTLDKLPGAFWIQALSVRIFGDHVWAIVLPQVIAGVLTVIFLMRAVERLMGTAAGLIAALVFAIASPATVSLNRGNISDTELVLFLVLAADATSKAIVTGRQRSLVLAGFWVGIAFQTKMVEAWLVLPAIGLAFLVARHDNWFRSLRQVAVAVLVAVIVSLSWMTVVTAIPQSSRPYVDGSQNDSLYQQVFVYNGFGRVGQESPVQSLVGQGFLANEQELITGPPPSWNRLLKGNLGLDTALLLPVALVIGIGGLFIRHRSFYVLWTGWLLTLLVVFSFGSSLNAYYTAALSPPIAGIVGAGVVSGWGVWKREKGGQMGAVDRKSVVLPIGALALLIGAMGYQLWLLTSPGTTAPNWMVPLAIAIGVLAVIAFVAWFIRPSRFLLLIAIVAGTASLLIVPTTGSGLLASQGKGIADTPFESSNAAQFYKSILHQPQKIVVEAAKGFRHLQDGAPYLMATQTSAVAAVFIDASGEEVLPIGGFSGTTPSPTLNQLKSDIRSGKFHLVLTVGKSQDPRLLWIRAHCKGFGPAGVGLDVCSPIDAETG